MSSRFEAEGIPDPGDLTPEQEATGQLDLTTEPPHDSPLGAEGWGTTAIEQREGGRAEAIMREHSRLAQRNLREAVRSADIERMPGVRLIRRRGERG